jgi:superfamily II DNA/RNA helicase
MAEMNRPDDNSNVRLPDKAPDTVHDPATTADVAQRIIAALTPGLLPKAVAIRTPLQSKIPISEVELPKQLQEFVGRYEPRVVRDGLFSHQAKALRAIAEGKSNNYVLTTTTASGKSLCFWAWVFAHILRDHMSTALLCFPTQALMWSQADRLAKMSDLGSTVGDIVAYGGRITIGDRQPWWSVWKGVGQNQTVDAAMKIHLRSDCFLKARVRIATTDKAHYSLLRDTNFVRNLSCVVLDEAHEYWGIFGANVRYFLKRLFAARDLLGLPPPGIFMASATVGDPIALLSQLLSPICVAETTFIADDIKPAVDQISLSEAVHLLNSPPSGELTRVVFAHNDTSEGFRRSHDVLRSTILGTKINAVSFALSKFQAKGESLHLKRDIHHLGRAVEVYDADIPPSRRRKIEARLNCGQIYGASLIATSALELGVDIESLDFCLLAPIPKERHAVIQRIGRVGRRLGKPGLVLMGLDPYHPFDQQLADSPIDVLRPAGLEALEYSTGIEMVRWKHMLAGYHEGLLSYYAKGDGERLAQVMNNRFGEHLVYEDLLSRYHAAYGVGARRDDAYWAHHGFRACASEGRVPLVELDGYANGRPRPRLISGQRHDIAWIQDLDLFRDAHPEGIFLGHDGRRWRIVAYGGHWLDSPDAECEWEAQKPDAWLHVTDAVYVKEIGQDIATRGKWNDDISLGRNLPTPDNISAPSLGELVYGVWSVARQWVGYNQVDLRTGQSIHVSASEVAERFRQAIEQGLNFPYLNKLTWGTLGWRWHFPEVAGSVLLKKSTPSQTLEPSRPPDDPATRGRSAWCMASDDNLDRQDVEDVLSTIIAEYCSSAVGCPSSYLSVSLDVEGRALTVLDETPNGNGISYALLRSDGMTVAMRNLYQAFQDQQIYSNPKAFRQRVNQLIGKDVDMPVEAIYSFVRDLCYCWSGSL